MNVQLGSFSVFWDQSDVVIKTVALLLLLMSIMSWFVILLRTWQWLHLTQQSKKAALFWSKSGFAEGLATLDSKTKNSPFYQLAAEGQTAVEHYEQHQHSLHETLPLTQWLSDCMHNSIEDSAENLQQGLSILASVGSTSPFIGLFGTVWGIYHALEGISAQGNANISTVAGPVGEALIMTACGLVVAIPAVLGYNAINRGNKKLLSKLNRFAHQLHGYFMTGITPGHSNKNFAAFVSATSSPTGKKAD